MQPLFDGLNELFAREPGSTAHYILTTLMCGVAALVVVLGSFASLATTFGVAAVGGLLAWVVWKVEHAE